MFTKPITMFASMIAVFASLTAAQAALTTDGGARPPVVRQDGSFQIAQSIWEPRRPPAVCVGCVRG